MWEKLKKMLFPAKSREQNFDQLSPIDVELAAEKLDVYQKGAADGRNNSPSSDSTSLTLAETRIVGFFQEEAQAAAKYFREKILDLEKIIKQKSLRKYKDRLDSIIPSFKASIETINSENKPNLIELKRRENTLHDEYWAFRRKNGLTRLADYPENYFFLVTIILAIFFIEALLNGYFFAKANEFGLVGGISQAIVTAFANIAISWIFGRFAFTQISHCSNIRKYVSMILVPPLFVFSIVFYNLFIGHFRDALSAAIDFENIFDTRVGQDVFQSVIDNPFELHSFDSWLLVFLGVIFAIIAAADGYYFDDPYPKFGRVARRHGQARQDYNDDKQDFLNELADLREDVIDEVKSLNSKIETISRIIHDIVTSSKKRANEFQSYMHDLDNKCNHILQLYRTSNSEARKDRKPIYFDEKYRLVDDVHIAPVEPLNIVEHQPDIGNVDGLFKTVTKVALEINKAYARIIEKINKELENIES